ncbi:hypothetical protein PINS_up001712 [Pythium insidiosum]|nr:hypothetical protein PINS_up001712 [Pythium insidiosum]
MPPPSRMDSDPSRLTTFPVPGFFSSTMQLVRESTIGSNSGDSAASGVKSNPPLSASQYWMPDHLCKVCYDCGASFSLFRRRHHCRLCGQIFCYECSGHFIDGAPHGFSGLIRICNFCARYVNASIETKRRASLRSSSSSVANLPSRQPSLNDLNAAPPPPPHSMSSLPVTSPLLFSPVNPNAAVGFNSVSTSAEHKDALASDMGSPQDLETDDAAASGSQQVPVDGASAATGRPKLATISSTDSMDYSGDPTAAIVTERVIKPRTSLSRRRRSSVELLGAIEAGGFLEGETLSPAAPSAPAPRTHRPSLTREALSFRLKSEIHTQREIVLDRYMQGAHGRIRTGIQRAVDRVAKHFVDDGLEVKRLTSTLEDMAFVVTGHLLFSMNFRSPNGFNYAQLVKVKSIATATANSSGPPSSGSSSSGARLGKDRYSFTWLAGTVCRKHLTHKQMARQIANPRILLLACGISYDRSFDASGGGNNGKLSSLDTLIEQERSYMGILVDKIARLEPDVIFVEHSVSRHAQELLHARGIAIVLNVKRATLERIARHTDAVLLPSVENIDQAEPDLVIGSCRAFYVRTFSVAHDPEDVKTAQGTPPLPTMMGIPPRSRNEAYMYLDGCDPLNGCTVLITGPTKKKLRILKSLMRSVLFMTYRLLLEAHVLSDLDIGVSAGCLPSALEDRERVVWCTVATLREQDAMPGKPRFYQCSLAKHIGIATYLDDDVSFGNYLLKEMEGLFLRCNNPKCSYMMVDHVQTYSCRVGTITVSFEELPDDVKAPTETATSDNADERELHVLGALASRATHFNPRSNTDEVPGCPTIIYWRWCNECSGVVSPFVPLQKHAYKYSFARLLEVFFSEKEQLPPASMGPLGSSAPYRSSACSHETMESHVLFFLVDNLVARMELSKRVAVSLTNNTHRRPIAQRRRRSISGPNADGGNHSTQTELCQAIVRKRRDALRDAFNGLAAQLSEQIAGIQQVIEECDAQSDVCMYLLVQVAAVKKVIQDDHAAMRDKLNDPEEEAVENHTKPMAPAGLSSIDPLVVKRVIVTDQLQRELYVTACKWIGELSQLHKQIKEHLSRDSNSISSVPPSPFSLSTFSFSGTPTTMSPAQSPRRGPATPKSRSISRAQSESVGERTLPPLPPSAVVESELASINGSDQQDPTSKSTSMLGSPRGKKQSFASSSSSIGPAATAAAAALRASGIKSESKETGWKSVLWDIYRAIGRSTAGDEFHFQLPRELIAGHPSLQTNEDGPVVLVNENEPITCVAYALRSRTHAELLRDSRAAVRKEVEMLDSDGAASDRTPLTSVTEGASLCWTRDELTARSNTTLKLAFADNPDHLARVASASGESWEFSVLGYFPMQFAALRGLLYGSDEDFLFSIAHVNNWEALGGKSGASFYRTVDDRFVVKHISSTELQSFLDVLPGYFKYMARVHFDGEDSVLSKTVGMYQTTITRKDTGQKSVYNIVVMENAFFQRQIARTFDLKGSSRNRYVKPSPDGKVPGVLLDGNLMELHEGHPVGVLVEDYEMLFRALRNDTQFLTSINIVDFSLVAGFGGDHAESSKYTQMTVGIIDYLRQFDLIKRVESVSKSVGMIAGQSSPTIIEPALYSKRFMDAMTRYFMPVTPISSNRNEAIILE